MLNNQDKKDIINDTIKDIHNEDIIGGIRNYNKEKGLSKTNSFNYKYDGFESNINLDWDHKKLDISNLIILSLILLINIYLVFSSTLKLLILSNISSIIVIYILYLDGSLEDTIESIFKDRLDVKYKSYLEENVCRYLDRILIIMKESNRKITKQELLDTNLLDHLDMKYIMISNELIVKRLINKILDTYPDLMKFKVNKNEADVIISRFANTRSEDIESNIIIKNKKVVVDCKIDNGTYCIGTLEEDSIIVEIEIDNDGNITIIDSKDLMIYINN